MIQHGIWRYSFVDIRHTYVRVQEGMREQLAREALAGGEGARNMDSPNDASSEDSNDSNRFHKGNTECTSATRTLSPLGAMMSNA